MKHQVYHSDIGEVHYWLNRVDKDQPTLLFTHGVLINHKTFSPQIKYFSKNHPVLVWDLPLHGQSNACSRFTFKDCARIMANILQEQEISKVILIGQSLGGLFCQEFADRYPDQVLGFIGIDTAPFGDLYYPPKALSMAVKPSSMGMNFPQYWSKYLTTFFATSTPMGYWATLSMMRDIEDHECHQIMDQVYTAIVQENRTIKRQHPSLLLAGQFDAFGAMLFYSFTWHIMEGIPLRLIPGAGHLSNNDNPWAVNIEIDNFIQGLAA